MPSILPLVSQELWPKNLKKLISAQKRPEEYGVVYASGDCGAMQLVFLPTGEVFSIVSIAEQTNDLFVENGRFRKGKTLDQKFRYCALSGSEVIHLPDDFFTDEKGRHD